MAIQEKAEKGRKGDKFIAHLTPGEIVIPRALAEDNDFRAIINEFFKDNNVDLEKFIVGSGKNSINPETGNIEFGFFSKITRPFKRIFKKIEQQFRAGGSIVAPLKSIKKRLFPEIKFPAPPPLPPPIPTPEDVDIGAQRAGAATRRRLGRRRGRAGTILTEIKPTPLGGLKTILG